MFSEGEDARRRLDSCAEEQAGIEIVHTKGAKCVSEHVNTSLGCTWPYRNRCAADIHARTKGYEFHRSEHSRSFPRASKLLRMNARVCLHVEYRVGYQQGEEWHLSVDLSFCRRACCLFGVRVLAPKRLKSRQNAYFVHKNKKRDAAIVMYLVSPPRTPWPPPLLLFLLPVFPSRLSRPPPWPPPLPWPPPPSCEAAVRQENPWHESIRDASNYADLLSITTNVVVLEHVVVA